EFLGAHWKPCKYRGETDGEPFPTEEQALLAVLRKRIPRAKEGLHRRAAGNGKQLLPNDQKIVVALIEIPGATQRLHHACHVALPWSRVASHTDFAQSSPAARSTDGETGWHGSTFELHRREYPHVRIKKDAAVKCP